MNSHEITPLTISQTKKEGLLTAGYTRLGKVKEVHRVKQDPDTNILYVFVDGRQIIETMSEKRASLTYNLY